MDSKLIGLLCATDSEAIAAITMELAEMNYIVMSDNVNFVFGVPSEDTVTPVMLMSHIDTVRKKDEVVPAVFFDTLYNQNGETCGALGADDRAGVYITLEIAKRLKHKPYILFTTGEETGHKGAAAFLVAKHPERTDMPEEFYKDKTVIEPYIDDIYCILQYDRRGMHDVVAYGAARACDDLINKALVFGYKYEHGSTSDCRNITEMHGIAHLNLSAGFLHEHCEEELLILPAVDFAIRNGVPLAQSIDKPFRVSRVDLFSAWPKKTYTYPPKDADDDKKNLQTLGLVCDICDKKRPTTYFAEADALICDKCLNRIGPIPISLSEVFWQKQLLEHQRDKSKTNNLPFVPSCPNGCSGDDVTMFSAKSKRNVFFCDECGTSFYQTKLGTYNWDIDNATDAKFRYHRTPDIEYEVNSSHELCELDNCQICGHLLPTENLAYYFNEETKETTLIVCDDCNVVDPAGRKNK